MLSNALLESEDVLCYLLSRRGRAEYMSVTLYEYPNDPLKERCVAEDEDGQLYWLYRKGGIWALRERYFGDKVGLRQIPESDAQWIRWGTGIERMRRD
jgi:hypothetical protein